MNLFVHYIFKNINRIKWIFKLLLLFLFSDNATNTTTNSETVALAVADSTYINSTTVINN